MSNAMLNSWERLNVHRAWELCLAWLPKGGDLQALGTLMDSVIILKNRFTDEGRTRILDLSLDRPGYVLTKTAAVLYVDMAFALSLILCKVTLSPVNHEVIMILASVSSDSNSTYADSSRLHFFSEASKYSIVQAGEWVLELLREACKRSHSGKTEAAIRQAAAATRHLLLYCNGKMRNFPAAWMYGRAMNLTYESGLNDVVPCVP